MELPVGVVNRTPSYGTLPIDKFQSLWSQFSRPIGIFSFKLRVCLTETWWVQKSKPCTENLINDKIFCSRLPFLDKFRGVS